MFLAGPREPQIVYGEPRQAWLDWLRAAAILMVLMSHYQIPWWQAGAFEPMAMADMRVGWSGVDFFFIVSGFLIGNLLIGEIVRYGRLQAGRFYFRRLLKIWPLYYLTCLVYVVSAPVLANTSMSAAVALITPALFHVQNYFQPAPLGHLWSLAVEEHFYLLLPILMVVCHRFSRPQAFARNLARVVLAGIALAVVLRAGSALYFHLGGIAVRGFTQFRIDSLFTGVALAWLYRYRPGTWRRAKNSKAWLIVPLLAGAATFAFNPNQSVFVAAFGYSLLAVMYGGLLVFFSRYEDRLPPVRLRVLLRMAAWVGRYSYPIYLFHPFVWSAMESHLLPFFATAGVVARSVAWPIGLTIFVASAVGIGAGVGIVLEGPLLRLRNRIMPPRVLALERSGDTELAK